MKSHRDLDVWKRSMDLVDLIYNITRSFPIEEQYGLKGQMRRCAVSVPSNIAEGAARSHKREFVQFLYISLGSLSELETRMLISERQHYLDDSDMIIEEIGIIRKLILGLIRSLKK